MKQIPNSFTTYELVESEMKNAQTLTSLNVAFLQNTLAQLAEEKLNLIFTPNDVLSYTQQEAYLKGQMDMLKYLLTSNDDVQHTLKEI